MDLLVITAEGEVEQELETIKALFANGLQRLHVRKPNWGQDKVADFLKRIGKKHYKRIALHGHPALAIELKLCGINLTSEEPIPERGSWHGWISRSFHKLEEIEECQKAEIDYVLLSPVFDSISKPGYWSAFDENELRSFLRIKRRCKVFGLGGIHADRIPLLQDIGFDGAAVLGGIWQLKDQKERMEMFHQLKEQCQKLEST